jgi:ligand-binding sensor domain-containing protein
LRTKVLLIILFVFFTQVNFAQKLSFEHINEQKGLDQINVLSLHQGPNHYLWVGTYFGLLRYDGNEFEKVIELDGNIEESSILSISSNTSQIFALSKKRIYTVEKNTLDVENTPFTVHSIIKPHKIIALRNCLLIAAENGLWKMDLSSQLFTNIHPGSPVTDLHHIETGKAIYSNSEGLHTYYPFIDKSIPLNYKPYSLILHFWVNNNQEIAWLEADNECYLGVITFKNIHIKKSFEIDKISKSSGFTKYKNYYYVGTRKGLLAISENGSWNYLDHNEEEFFSLSQNFVSCMLVDNTNNFWVGTEIGGLNLHHPNRYLFPVVSYLQSTNMSKCKEILSFAETNSGDILFQNTIGGLGVFDPKTSQVKKWIKTGLIGNCMVSKTANQNTFLIGTPEGLFEYDHQREKTTFLSTKNEIKNFESDIKHILPVGQNLYWMGGSDGLFLYDAKTKQTLAHYSISNTNLGSNNIRSISFKNTNELLVSTSKGLYVFNIRKNSFTLIPLSTDKKEPMVSSSKIASNGNIWVGTAGKGIVILHTHGKKTYLDVNAGLSNLQIYSLTFNQAETECWVATNHGLSCINTKNLAIKNYHIYDGLQGSEFFESSVLNSRNGYLYFGGVAGFNFFDPNTIKLEKQISRIAIKGISVFNERLPYQSYYNIPSAKNYLSLDFTSLDFNLNSSHTYYCKIEGIDTGFNEIGNRRFASFGQLLPGEYEFKVKVANANGNILSNEASLAFKIVPMFYQTYWFKILSSFLMASLIAFFIYNRTQKAIKEEKEKGIQENLIALLELKALRAQMNPHFIFNSLNSIQYFVINNEKTEAAKYLSKFAKLIRMILDVSEQTFVSISSKVEFLKLYTDLEALRLNNSFSAEYWIDPLIDQNILIPTLLIQPHVENAIWHGLQSKQGDKKLNIQFFYLNEKTLQVIIEDNGIGREAAKASKKQKISLHQSKGFKLSEDRIKTLKKLFGSHPKIEIIDLFDQNHLACGTKVIINVPIIHG